MINSEYLYKLIIKEIRKIVNKPIRNVKNFKKFIKTYKYKEELIFLTGVLNNSSIIDVPEFISFCAKVLKYDFTIPNLYKKINYLINLYLEEKNKQIFLNKSKKEKILQGLYNIGTYCKKHNLSYEDFIKNHLLQFLKNNYITFHTFVLLVSYNYRKFKEILDSGQIDEELLIYFEEYVNNPEFKISDIKFKQKVNKFFDNIFKKEV